MEKVPYHIDSGRALKELEAKNRQKKYSSLPKLGSLSLLINELLI